MTAGEAGPVYALGADAPERQRLRQQAKELRAHSEALLDRVGAAPGWRAIDLGCGPLGVLDILSERVGPSGSVIGLDYDPVNVAMARDFVGEHRLANVEVMESDARNTGLPESSFDLVHARTLLINLPEPAEVVSEMVRLARPGGWVAAMEPDVRNMVCYPPIPAWDRMQELFEQSYVADGADPLMGRRLSSLLWDAGLVDIGVEPRAEAFPLGHSRRTIRADILRAMRPKLIQRGMAGEQELGEIDTAFRKHLENPRTLLCQSLFMAWGRKPAA
ncbi:MAG TPA: methyltransferase domain-containing protein [Candidatus Dormibacteraeota bacterium]|nr:methyltransferase domain-containing protein [Candidatus Dormibacteraeota bacterium]